MKREMIKLLKGCGFCDDHPPFSFINPFEIEKYMQQFSLTKLSIFGAEGFFSQSEYILANDYTDVIDDCIEISQETAESQGVLASSEHIVYIGMKNKQNL
jgi:hypothetical protein